MMEYDLDLQICNTVYDTNMIGKKNTTRKIIYIKIVWIKKYVKIYIIY